ncbi:MAG TPA: hypothetical protein VFE32_05870 [Puia sp.]|jgi:hypothetical protein|nr:hypothetical protein [Puia sp.]
MNEVFSFTRFRRLFVKHTMEHLRTYLMSIGVLLGVLLLGGAFMFYMIPDAAETTTQTGIFVILLFLAGSFFTSTIFADYGDSKKAIPALTLPATALEKFLVGWLYSYPIFLAVYIGIFYLTLGGLSSFKHWNADQHFHILNLLQPGMTLVYVAYSAIHALSLYGAVFFRKLHFIKLGFAFFISLAIVIMANTVFLKIITGLKVVRLAVPFGFLDFFVNNSNYSISVMGPFVWTVLDILWLVTVLLWVAAFFRLKEKQV